ncbi:hypothetical protein BaRGS_00011951, partial [Batillaria attramentaria]
MHTPSSSVPAPCLLCTERWRLAIIGFFGFVFVYALRVNMSVAIVCMVKADNSTGNSSDDNSQCSANGGSDSGNRGEFDWDKSVQSGILSSFFYGYIVTQIPGGWLAGRFGGKRVLGIAMIIVAVATLVLPSLARVDYRFVFALRILMGLASGVSFPTMHAMWGKWAPPSERSRLASFTYTGLMLGNIVTFIFSGLLCAYGGATFIWLFFWWVFVSDTPDTCPRITKAERDYIVNSIGDAPEKTFTVPWKSIAMSRALWVCLTAHFCNNWMHYTLLTSLPTFMKEVLHFDIKSNGVLSAVPYMVMMVTAISCGHVADYVRARCCSTKVTRRVVQALSFLGAGGMLVGAGFVNCESREMAVVLLALAVGFEGLCYSGYMVNQIDFAPRYAGVLFGISNCVSTIPGMVAPLVAGALTPDKTQEEWRNVFYVCGGFTLLGAIVFGGFAVTDTEPWAKDLDDVTSAEIIVKPAAASEKMEMAGVAEKNGTLAYDN